MCITKYAKLLLMKGLQINLKKTSTIFVYIYLYFIYIYISSHQITEVINIIGKVHVQHASHT